MSFTLCFILKSRGKKNEIKFVIFVFSTQFLCHFWKLQVIVTLTLLYGLFVCPCPCKCSHYLKDFIVRNVYRGGALCFCSALIFDPLFHECFWLLLVSLKYIPKAQWYIFYNGQAYPLISFKWRLTSEFWLNGQTTKL